MKKIEQLSHKTKQYPKCSLEEIFDGSLGKGTKVIGLKNHRDQETFNSFLDYWLTHEEERFFQAIRNFLGCAFLMADGVDTFYFEGKSRFKKNKKTNKKKI